ncbi:MAG: MSHA biogenesis protein MshJ [Proteobacteria bacterium]|nr:MSHA biogenesis protein MshJ [Pseudomonadota bacterium]
MKQRLLQWMKKIDALTLRERAIMFVMAALGLAMGINFLLIDPQFKQQKALAQQIAQDRAKVAEMQSLIQLKLRTQTLDPDANNKAHLQKLQQDYRKTQGDLDAMRKGLVPPDKMNALLEDILKRNGKLRLVALKTLPVGTLGEGEAGTTSSAAASSAASAVTGVTPAAIKPATIENAIFRHSVEITVEGAYLDMIAYLTALENLPRQVFWSKANLNVDAYPKATLTLTLFTLSLDEKWLNL